MTIAPFDGSIALIRRTEPSYSSWLACWHDQSECLEFIVSPRLGQESYRDCLSREIAWTLRLARDRDYLVSSVARLHYESHELTVEFFVVEPYGKSFHQLIDANSSARWVRRHELENRRTDDGLAVSDGLCELLFAADALPYDFNF